MVERMDLFGRYEFDWHNSGIDSSDVWSDYVGPLYEAAWADPERFLTELRHTVAGARGGFAVFGAACLAWKFFGKDCLELPAAWPLIDAGIEFKRRRGLGPAHLTGYEQQRLLQLRAD